MGKVTDSLLSGTRGRTGRIVVTNIQGNEISRMRPRRGNRNLTPKQILVTQRFNDAIQFIQGYKNIAKNYYGKRNGLKSAYNMALGNLIKSMPLDTVNLTYQMNYDAIQFTRGNLPEPQPIGWQSDQPLTIAIAWQNNAIVPEQELDTLCVMISEDGVEKPTTTIIQTQAIRAEEETTIEVLPRYQGKTLHVWITFINPTQMVASNSVYLGTIDVA